MKKQPAGQRAPDQGQTDLFGAVTAQAQQTRSRPPSCAPPHFAQSPSRRAPASAKTDPPRSLANGLLNVRQAAARLGLSKSTLDKMRCAGKGPRFIKSTDRAVRYDPADLDAWIANRRRTSTSHD